MMYGETEQRRLDTEQRCADERMDEWAVEGIHRPTSTPLVHINYVNAKQFRLFIILRPSNDG